MTSTAHPAAEARDASLAVADTGDAAGRALDAPDMPVPTMDRERLLGNYVILGCEEGVYVVLAHFAPGTVEVDDSSDLVETMERRLAALAIGRRDRSDLFER